MRIWSRLRRLLHRDGRQGQELLDDIVEFVGCGVLVLIGFRRELLLGTLAFILEGDVCSF
jgi:hypothetical protein